MPTGKQGARPALRSFLILHGHDSHDAVKEMAGSCVAWGLDEGAEAVRDAVEV